MLKHSVRNGNVAGLLVRISLHGESTIADGEGFSVDRFQEAALNRF
jgi:hypothetical protein